MKEADIQLLVETLRWYAESSNYDRIMHSPRMWSNPPACIDRGAQANFVQTMLEEKGKA